MEMQWQSQREAISCYSGAITNWHFELPAKRTEAQRRTRVHGYCGNTLIGTMKSVCCNHSRAN